MSWLLVAAPLLCLADPCALVGARVEVGDGTVHERATVLLRDGKIVAVGPRLALPEGTRRIDVSGKTITPGLVEVHSLFGLSEVSAVQSTSDHALGGEVAAPGFRVAPAFNPESMRIPLARSEGITGTVIRPTGALLHGEGVWVDLSGELADRPDPTRPAAAFGAVGEGAAASVGGSRGGVWLRLRQHFEDARAYGKDRKAFERGASRPLSLSPLHLRALLPVLAGALPLVLEADRASDILAALDLAREEKLRLVITGGAEAWRVAAELKAAGVPVILRPSQQRPTRFETLKAVDDAATRLHAAGVRLVITGAGWTMAPGRLRQEAGLAVAQGLPRAEALRAITLTPAELMGKGAELGSLSPGKRATLVVWSGDPLELSTVAETVLIDGRERSLRTRQLDLAERYLAR
ncbi:MAG: amidohydrolase family protein [Deltaproteobacteria bacterium]|nr:amidohydrolase family protein [Deltaproteobacteria bacterium]